MSSKGTRTPGVGLHENRKSDTRPVGVGLSKKPTDLSTSEIVTKPKDLSPSESEERGHGDGVSTENVNESVSSTTYDVGMSPRRYTRITRFFENSSDAELFLSSKNRIDTPRQNLVILPKPGNPF
jgi:hypothetical protein